MRCTDKAGLDMRQVRFQTSSVLGKVGAELVCGVVSRAKVPRPQRWLILSTRMFGSEGKHWCDRGFPCAVEPCLGHIAAGHRTPSIMLVLIGSFR